MRVENESLAIGEAVLVLGWVAPLRNRLLVAYSCRKNIPLVTKNFQNVAIRFEFLVSQCGSFKCAMKISTFSWMAWLVGVGTPKPTRRAFNGLCGCINIPLPDGVYLCVEPCFWGCDERKKRCKHRAEPKHVPESYILQISRPMTLQGTWNRWMRAKPLTDGLSLEHRTEYNTREAGISHAPGPVGQNRKTKYRLTETLNRYSTFVLAMAKA